MTPEERDKKITQLKSELFDIIRRVEIMNGERIKKIKELEQLERESK